MEIIIEEISKGHKLIGRHKFSQPSLNIGRGYQNDIIISDPHVCADHLNFNFDGEAWFVSDADTINGSFLEDSKQVINNHKIKSGDVISLGKSQIRVYFPNHPIEDTATFSPFENLINIARHPATIAFSIALFAFVTGFIFYLNNGKEVTFTQLLVPAISMTLMFALWPAAISVVSHLTKHDARITSQLGICFIFFNLMWVSDIIERFVQFNVSSQWPLMWLVSIVPIGLAFCLFWFNCSIGFHTTERRRMVISIGLTVLLYGGTELIQLSKKPEFNPLPQYNATLMTPNFNITASSSVDEFVADSTKLFEKATKEIDKD
ncbi:FHA domain-containing protein [Pseudocolwellia agarivorans]|uniref:FHA domain-containing protein n=1 Tax=Pseudocolwellia agarivorans TaxID=1911682 RepID=UPI000984203C|nr:FHA domain-containing protein [Pseudocolwellia agarivorans]